MVVIYNFRNIDDIDLVSGILVESPAEGTKMSPTLECILEYQFQRLRQSDRFWYENNDSTLRFTNGRSIIPQEHIDLVILLVSVTYFQVN
jgi:hypothetical protein